jgi:hypothetical protein
MLDRQSSTRNRGRRKYLMGYVQLKKYIHCLVINTEQPGPDLGLATGKSKARTFHQQVRTRLLVFKKLSILHS